VENNTQYMLEWVHFPDLILVNDLVSNGGKARILWPLFEGELAYDDKPVDTKQNNLKRPGYPSAAWEGRYPGPCSMQFMAYCSNSGGLYLGAHDEECGIKTMNFYIDGPGVSLDYRIFTDGMKTGRYDMNFDMVLAPFSGEWYDAADIYRNWFEKSSIKKAPKLYNSTKIAPWFEKSPVVLIYPIRGEYDDGEMEPNEYYPYTNAIKHIDRLSEDFNSPVMALLMHWEGTAPWAPPYTWPPYGDREDFKEFVDKLHQKGNLAGVYCSGIAWTQESIIFPEYNRREQFEKENLKDVMCISPQGELPYSSICNGRIRWGYEMCPSQPFVKDVVLNEISNLVDAGLDYIQYFDQTIGGASCFCYSKNHGHPPAPGKWQNEAMLDIFKGIEKILEENNFNTLVGTEAAASEQYIPYLMFNDLRFGLGLGRGAEPVPVYSYVFHEYINNFMGNQCAIGKSVDNEKSPDNLLFRTAYSFAAGDMMSVVLKGNGEINWSWNTHWDVPSPDQQSIRQLICNLNGWRRGLAKPFLCFGRMIKPVKTEVDEVMKLHIRNGISLEFPVIISSMWQDKDGNRALIAVNYTRKQQNMIINLPGYTERSITVHDHYDGSGNYCADIDEEKAKIYIKPLSAIMIFINHTQIFGNTYTSGEES
jgi:hypothetical protein